MQEILVVAEEGGPVDHTGMRLPKMGRHVLLAVVVASSLMLRPAPARASDVADAAPFMIFAAAFTVTIIIIAVNNPASDSTSSSSTDTSSSSTSQPMRAAPPARQAPVFGLSGHF